MKNLVFPPKHIYWSILTEQTKFKLEIQSFWNIVVILLGIQLQKAQSN